MKILIFLTLIVLIISINSVCFDEAVVDMAGALCPESAALDMACLGAYNQTYCQAARRKYQYPGNTDHIITCTGSLGSVNCTEKCTPKLKRDGNPDTPKECNGDSSYCQIVGHDNCKKKAMCFCTVNYFRAATEAWVNNAWVSVVSKPVMWNNMPVDFEEPHYNLHPFEPKGQSKKREADTHTSFSQPIVTVSTPAPGWTFVYTSKDSLSDIHGCAKAHCEFELPDSYFVNPGQLVIKVYINDTLEETQIFDTSSYVVCQIPRCVFCSEMWFQIPCLPWEFKAAISSVCILAILMLIIVLWLIVRMVKASSCSMRGMSIPRINFNVQNFTHSQQQEVMDGNDEEMVPLDQEKEEGSVLNGHRGKRLSLRQIMGLQILAITCLVTVVSAACTSGVTIPGTSTTCFVNGSTQNCSTEFQMLLTIPFPGSSACLSFADPDNSDNVLATLNITYDQATSVVSLATMYYTSAWNGLSESQRTCPWVSPCDTGSACSDYDPTADPTVDGSFTGPLASWPGRSRCDSQCGCAGCGCFSCDSSCVFSRYAFQPVGNVTKVSVPNTYAIVPRLKAILTVQGVSTSSQIDVTGISASLGSNYSIQLQGLLTGSTTIFGTRKILSNSGGAWYGFASEVNAPIGNSVGDIQANSPAQLTTPAANAFVFSNGIVTIHPNTYSTSYTFLGNGARLIPTYSPFPLVVGSTLWSYSGSQLTGLNTNPGAVVFTVSTTRPLIITRLVNVVCPSLTSVSVAGCYGCAEGATLTISAKSLCSAGPSAVSVTSGTLLTPTVDLDITETQALIRVQFDAASVDGDITLTTSSRASTLHFSGTLSPPNLVQDDNSTFSNNPKDVGGQITDFFKGALDWFTDLGQTIQWVIIAAVIVAILLAIGFIVWKCWPTKPTYVKVDN